MRKTMGLSVFVFMELRVKTAWQSRKLPDPIVFRVLCFLYLLSCLMLKGQPIEMPNSISLAYGIQVVPIRLNIYTEPELSPLSSS
jgi:hypothetical protein